MVKLREFTFRPSDLLLFVYIDAVTRQFFWGVPNQLLAWTATATVSAIIISAHVRYRETLAASDSQKRKSNLIWLVYAPLIVVFVIRAPFPDYNYDVLNYHLEYMERALRGWPFISGDFFPATIQFNPSADIATGIFKYLLGFRLGHVINLAAVLWTASIAERFLRDAVRNTYLRHLAAVVIVSTELILFLQSIYLVDLLALPLLAEAAWLAVSFKTLRRKSYSLVHIGLFLGISLAFKISNLPFIVPIAALAFYQAYIYRRELSFTKSLAAMIAALLTPVAPFLVYMFLETGNPVFPLYNRVFRSPYWTPDNLSVPGFGPQNILQTLLWPFWVYIYPERGSEFSGGDNPYTGRLPLALIFVVVCLLSRRVSTPVKHLAIVTGASIFLWSASSGNLRYGVCAEVLGGVVIISVLAALIKASGKSSNLRERRTTLALAVSFAVLTAMQVVTSYKSVFTLSRASYGDKVQATIFQDPHGYAKESAQLFRDRRMADFLSPEERQMIAGVDVWVNSYPTTVGLMAGLRPELPILGVTLFQPSPGNFDPLKTTAGNSRYQNAKQAAAGKHLYSIVYEAQVTEALAYLSRAGLRPKSTRMWQLPYYSTYQRMNVALIELENVETDRLPVVRQ
jgi:hypothetical protein